jgi:hypothetical protein
MLSEARLSPIERRTLDRVVCFVATAFRGRGKFESEEVASLDDALLAADRLFQDRPVIVYAIDYHGSKAMIGSWSP